MNPDCPETSVIILNLNGESLLPDCLNSLAAQTYTNFETIVVDNGSSDGSLAYVEKLHPQVKVVPLDENSGFARGNNIGLENAQGRYLVTLNNDTSVDREWLEKLVQLAEAEPDVGMVGSRICCYSEPDCVDSLGILICRDGMSRGAYRNRSFSSLGINEDFEILLPSACAALYKREMIEQIGFFDEDFFAYCEDTDLGLRGRRYGWRAMLALNAIVRHKYSRSGGAFSPFKLYHVERNHFWVLMKNYPFSAILCVPIWTLYRYLLQMKLVLFSRGSGAEFRGSSNLFTLLAAILKGMCGAVSGAGRNWRKRCFKTSARRISDKEFLLLLKRYHLRFRELLDDAG